jgi:signal transduction histidine kinase
MNDLSTLAPTTGAADPPAPERRRAPRQVAVHAQAWLIAAATLGLVVTTLLVATPAVQFSSHDAQLHLAVELMAALASAVTALLVYGRFRSTLQSRDLVLFAAFTGFAATNLLFSTVPSIVEAHPSEFRALAPVLGSTASTALFACAAFLPARLVRRPGRAVPRALAAVVAGLAASALAAVLAGDRVPLAPFQIASAALFAVAAGRFAMRADRDGDVLARWLAVGATLGAFARLNYALFPSLSTDWLHAGDVLRLAGFAALFCGALQETLRLQRALAASAVVDERHRIARNIHDGVAQDLAYIVQQLRRLEGADDAVPRIDRLVHAAEHALDESRHAVAALSRAADRPLGELLAITAHEAGEREGSSVVTDVAEGVAVPARSQEELLRIVREAVINAARHGRANTIEVRLRIEPALTVTVSDDGAGFDPEAIPAGRTGLESMRARAASIGAELAIRSRPGGGTEVRVVLP